MITLNIMTRLQPPIYGYRLNYCYLIGWAEFPLLRVENLVGSFERIPFPSGSEDKLYFLDLDVPRAAAILPSSLRYCEEVVKGQAHCLIPLESLVPSQQPSLSCFPFRLHGFI